MKCDTEKFIEKSKKIQGDRYDYSLVKYINNTTKVKIICKTHGVFEQSPASHTKSPGCGCPKCHVDETRGLNINMVVKNAQ